MKYLLSLAQTDVMWPKMVKVSRQVILGLSQDGGENKQK